MPRRLKRQIHRTAFELRWKGKQRGQQLLQLRGHLSLDIHRDAGELVVEGGELGRRAADPVKLCGHAGPVRPQHRHAPVAARAEPVPEAGAATEMTAQLLCHRRTPEHCLPAEGRQIHSQCPLLPHLIPRHTRVR